MNAEISKMEARLDTVGAAPEDRRERVDALTALAWELRIVQTKRAHELANEARTLAIETGYRLGQARAARVLSMTLASEHTLRKTLVHGEEAKVLFDEVGDRAGSAGARDFLAGVFELIGDSTRGMELALEALEIAREIDDPVRQGFALSNVGGLLASSGEVQAGFEKLREALRLFESVDHCQGIGRICSRLSQLCRDTGQLDEALAHARRGLKASDRSGSFFDRAAALAVLGELELQNGNTERAEELFRSALEAFPQPALRVIGGLPTVVSLGRLLTRRGALHAAEDLLEGARQQLCALGLWPPQLAPLFQVLADIAEQRGDSAAVIAHLREVIRLKEQAARDEVKRERTQLELRAEMKATRQEAEIHRLKYVELTEMQTQLVEAEKMAQLGSLAAGTAHELNTPLGVLRSNLHLQARALERLAQISIDNAASHAQIVRLQQALAACTRTSEEALARIATVAESFKLFTQLDLADRRVFNVVEGLRSAIALLRPNLPVRITLDSQFEPVPDIAGWPGQLNQAFMTVLLNATQAIDGQGSVTVETSAAQSGVMVRVRDTGRGMTEAERTQLFDVGWSSGGTRLRMRLGLSAAYATVLRHRGRVDVQTAPGQGTTFVLSFPSHDGA